MSHKHIVELRRGPQRTVKLIYQVKGPLPPLYEFIQLFSPQFIWKFKKVKTKQQRKKKKKKKKHAKENKSKKDEE